MSADEFYNESKSAIVPMGFCYPEVDAKGGEKLPHHEYASEWQPPLLAALPNVKLSLLIGQYEQLRYLAKSREKTLADTGRHWRNYVWVQKNP
tara:strand:+ start:435 stop:713 length:279 start_codon:yes stop_codon:yes gene_type:complete